MNDLERCANEALPWETLNNKSILITGATGLIGSFLVDVLMYRNLNFGGNITLYAVGRNDKTAKQRFEAAWEAPQFHFLQQSVEQPIKIDFKCDYIIHAASNAHPITFSTDPVGTMQGNYIGMLNLLEFARKNFVKRTLFVSSGEIYGQSSNETGSGFDENYSGTIDSTNSRSCYPISKRAAETLCACYTQQYGVETVIARPCHIYGATQTLDDSRVSAQFIRNVLAGQDIVMKSNGSQVRTYCYVSDCVSALLYILLCGATGEAYNIADKSSLVSIKELAEMVADVSHKQVVMEQPCDAEKSGYTKVQRAVLNAGKLEKLGWQARVHMQQGVERTVEILEHEDICSVKKL